MKFPKLLLIAVFMMVSSVASYADDEGYIGEVTLFAGNFAPRFHAFCNGQILSISSNQVLFSLLGSTYGGDGRTTFALPNLQEAEKSLKGVRYIIQTEGIYPSRS